MSLPVIRSNPTQVGTALQAALWRPLGMGFRTSHSSGPAIQFWDARKRIPPSGKTAFILLFREIKLDNALASNVRKLSPIAPPTFVVRPGSKIGSSYEENLSHRNRVRGNSGSSHFSAAGAHVSRDSTGKLRHSERQQKGWHWRPGRLSG